MSEWRGEENDLCLCLVDPCLCHEVPRLCGLLGRNTYSVHAILEIRPYYRSTYVYEL